MGTRTQKRGDHGRSRTRGRINRGDGDGGEPVGAHQAGELSLAKSRCTASGDLGVPA